MQAPTLPEGAAYQTPPHLLSAPLKPYPHLPHLITCNQERATHSSIPVWIIPRTEEPGGPLAIKKGHYQANWVCLQLCPLDLKEESKDSGLWEAALTRAGLLAKESSSPLTTFSPGSRPCCSRPE